MTSAKLSAARLVEQLQLTNERLERLETEIRRAAGLPSIEPDAADARLQSNGAERTPTNVPGPASSNPQGANRSDGTNRPAQDSSALGESQSTIKARTSDVASTAQTERSPVTAAQIEGYFRRADVLFQSGKPDAAVKVWRQLLEIQPENTWALTNIGIVYTDQGRWSEALKIFTEVARLQPDSLEAHYGLGLVHAHQGNYPVAAAEWKYVLRLQPDNEDARVNLSIVEERMALEKTQGDAAAASAAISTPAPERVIDDHAASSTAAQMVQDHREDHPQSAPTQADEQTDVASSIPDSTLSESETVRRALDAKSAAERQNRGAPSDRARTVRFAAGFMAVATVAAAAWFMVAKLHSQAPAAGAENVVPPGSRTQTAASIIDAPSSTSREMGPVPDQKTAAPVTGDKPETVKPSMPTDDSDSKPPPVRFHRTRRASVPVVAHANARPARVFNRSRAFARRPRPAIKKQVSSGFNQGAESLLNQIP
jgi:tetratricopeptide (TPR) repeat protein